MGDRDPEGDKASGTLASGPGGAQLSVITPKTTCVTQERAVHATAGGLDGVLEAFPEEAVLGLGSAGG